MKRSTKNKIKKTMKDENCCTGVNVKAAGCGGCGYCLGVIGAAIYYISTATGFWNGTWGVIKALLWPAFLIFEVLKFVGA